MPRSRQTNPPKKVHGIILRSDRIPAGRAPDDQPPVVYVLDDDEGMRLALSSLFRSIGLRVETFDSSQAFLAFPKYDAPSCLVLDVRLRGESGLAFQEELAKTDLRMPIVFMKSMSERVQLPLP